MSTTSSAQSAVRLSFQLGPWLSPRSQGWRAAYDALLASLSEAGRPVYGVLTAGLAGGRAGGAAWRRRFAANAAEVVARYADRIPAFEILPGPNHPAPDRSPPLSAEIFAGVLADVYGRVQEAARGQDVQLVAGAVAHDNDGPGYLARAIQAGRESPAWAATPGLERGALPMDAVAAWLELPAGPGPISPGYLAEQVAALLAALGTLEGAGSLPVYISGLTRQVHGEADFDVRDVAPALDELCRSHPRVRLAAAEAAAAGPRYASPEEPGASSSFTFAIAGIPERRRGLARRAEIPVIDGFDFAVGRRDAAEPPQANFAMTTSLVDPGYYEKFNHVWHPGEDWAMFGPCDAGLGAPVYAIADGLVVRCNYFTPNWGNIILIRHILRSGATVWSQYAHLDACLVAENAVVRRGQQIGTIGKGAGNFCAHLHFEIRHADLAADSWFPLVRDKQSVLANYLSPADFIRAHRPNAPLDRRGIVVDNEPRQQQTGTFARTEIPGHWRRSYFGWNDTADYTFASTVETDWGEWRPQLPAPGRYEVQAWIPGRHATTKNAVYAITHAGGGTAQAVNQNAFSDQWVALGTYDFAAEGAVVRLTDKTGEADNLKLEVCFDAVRWLPA